MFYRFDNAHNIVKCRIVLVYNKPAVLCADLSPSAGSSFKSADFNKPCGKVALRALEGTPRTWIFKRLFILPALHQRIHTVFYLTVLTLCKLHLYRCYAKLTLREKAVSVGQLHFFERYFLYVAFLVNITAGYNNIFHLAAVRACVHKYRTADRTRYAVCKLKPRKLVFKCHRTDSRKRRARIALNNIALYPYRTEITADKQYSSVKSLVRHKNIASSADNIVPDVILTAQLYKLAQQCLTVYLYHHITRSAYTKRGVSLHRFISEHDRAVFSGSLLQYAVIVQSILLANLFFAIFAK